MKKIATAAQVEGVTRPSLEFVLNWFKDAAYDIGDDIETLFSMGMGENWYWWVSKGKVTEQDATVLEKLSKKEWEDLFKQQFSKTSKQMVSQGEDDAWRRLSADQTKVLKAAQSVLGSGIDPRSISGETGYFWNWKDKNQNKLILTMPYLAPAAFTDEYLREKKVDIPLTKVAEILTSLRWPEKAKAKKVVRRHTPPLYD